MSKPIAIACILVSLAAAAQGADTVIWIEGEQAVKRQLVPNSGLDAVNPDELSGGKWVCSFSHENEPTGTVEYVVEIAAAGSYHLWVRASGGTGLAYRVDGAKDAVEVPIKKGHNPIPIAAATIPRASCSSSRRCSAASRRGSRRSTRGRIPTPA